MAKAQEITGDTPPLKKSTINKAHKIAKAIEEGKNKDGKEQGADGKACCKGYKYAGTENGKDKCVPVEELQSMHDSLMESGLFDEDEIRNIIGEAWEELDEKSKLGEELHPSVKRIDAMNKERVVQRAAAAASDAAARQRSAAAFQAHKKAHIAAGGTPVSALDTWQQKKNSEGKK